MAKEFIVAIEIGSSKLTGIAGKNNPDGSITVLATASEDSTSYIRKGVVYNIDKTSQGLNNIITKLKNTLQTEIMQVYVGIGGQSIRSVKNVVIKDLPLDAIVSQEMVNELMDANRNMSYPEYEIQDAITEEYKVDAQYQTDPVGIQAMRLEGNFLNVLWRRTFYRNLNKSFDNAGIAIAETCLAPLALAENVLTEAEKRAGCVLVDLGADTTAVSVYYRDKLRNIAVIPLGSNNVTKDLESLQIDEREAEALKIKYGSAFTDTKDVDPNKLLPIDGTRTITCKQLIEIVEARMLEIIENTKRLIPNEYIDKLLGGIVLTGGGSNMNNIERAFREITHIEKVRVAKFVTTNINTKDSDVTLAHDGTMNSILSILAKGNMNCAGRELNVTLNDDDDIVTTPPTSGPTAEELAKKAEEERLRREAEEAERKRKEEERKEEEEKKKNTRWKGLMNKGKSFFSTIFEPEVND